MAEISRAGRDGTPSGSGGGMHTAAGWWHRWRAPGSAKAGVALETVTVLGTPDEVRAAWDQRARPPGNAVDFHAAPGGRGTEVRVLVEGVDRDALRSALREFKSLVECSTVVTAGPQPSGRGPVREAVTRAVTSRLRDWGGA